jgi:hypothetical protein
MQTKGTSKNRRKSQLLVGGDYVDCLINSVILSVKYRTYGPKLLAGLWKLNCKRPAVDALAYLA